MTCRGMLAASTLATSLKRVLNHGHFQRVEERCNILRHHSNLTSSSHFILSRGGGWKRKWVWAIVVVCLVIVAVIVRAVVSTQRPHPCTTCNQNLTTTPIRNTMTSIQISTPAMTGSAAPLTGYIYPTAISLGYPHLEIFAARNDDNNVETVHWKWRGLNSSDNQLSPTDGSLHGLGAFWHYTPNRLRPSLEVFPMLTYSFLAPAVQPRRCIINPIK
ncbi:hypothetical protein BDZ45DRAFT_17622 [Acephala macrosclerotiorum]|nr:hypothetical protein BDZ45DRAFT_17622 [Acephala macrosclerotiorum]